MTDYLILGGGIAGCVLATRLKEYQPSLSVTLIEAGPNEHENPLITEPMGTFQLHMSTMQYNYKTVPQKNFNNRRVYNAGGKQLSGSSSVNYAAWTRGDATDYNLWGKIVGDERWTYKGQLPYMKRTESHHDPDVNADQHGTDGPVYSTSATRNYPLTEPMKQAYMSIGVKSNQDANSGDPKGIAAYTENWRAGKRQPAGKSYGLDGVDVITNTSVRKILFEQGLSGKPKAIGAELNDGRTITAKKEVVLSCGALRSPQILMISGIGPFEELDRLEIPQFAELPVGKNLFDHCTISQFFKVKNAEKGVCAGSPAFNDPSYLEGMPVDWVVTENVPSDILKTALKLDGEDPETHPHVNPLRSHYELLPMYAPAESPLTEMNVPFDGTILTVGVLNMLPTSRGTLTLASCDPTADPLIDPNYYDTEVDRCILRCALRRNIAAMETEAGQSMIQEEFPPKNYAALTSKATDEQLDGRIRRAGSTWFHAGGTCSMGQVVDTDLRVKGVDNLRVVDAGVIPTPIAAHFQVATYALAEQAADIMSGRTA